MAIYQRHRVPTAGDCLCTAWSYPAAGPAAFAAGTAGGVVNVYNQEGVSLGSEGESLIKSPRGKDPVALAWHPQQRLLAIGWKDGALSFWKETDRRLLEDTSVHRRPITCLLWNSEGTRLVSGDEEGRVGVWRADQRGKPTTVAKYLEKTEGRISSLCFDTCAAPSPEFIDPALPPPCPPFYYSLSTGEKGVVCHADDKGKKVLAYEVDGPVMAMLYYKERNGLVVITANFTLTVHTREANSWALQTKVKLSKAADVTSLEATWAGPHVLALASDKDSLLRMSDLESEENFTLQLPDSPGTATRILALAYNSTTSTLAAGLKDGRIHMWRQVGERGGPPQEPAEEVDSTKAAPEQLWQAQPALSLGSPVLDLNWGAQEKLIAAVTADSVVILVRSEVARKVRDRLALVQTRGGQVAVEATDSSNRQVLNSELQVAGVDVSDTHVLVWGGKAAEVYELGLMGLRQTGAFEIPAGAQLAIHHDSIFQTKGTTVEICTLQGTVKQTLLLDEVHGEAAHLSACEDFLAVATSNGYIKLWKVGGREAKPHGAGLGRKVEIDGVAVGDIHSIRLNCNGNKVSILARTADESRSMDSRVFVYDTELDAFLAYDFRAFHRRPVSHFWDGEEPKLLACETQLDRAALVVEGLRLGSKEKDLQVTTLFSSPDHGILYQDKVDLEEEWGGLVGLQVPYLYFFAKPPAGEEGVQLPALLCPKVMRDFAGMENVDAKTRKALLGFSYHLAIGNMDEAYKAVKLIKNPAVWENMAQLCVKTKRVDVAEHCLGNMGHARGAKAVREALQEPEIDARVAAVAIQLGLLDDAQKLYANCERWDLLNQLYQASGEWAKALEVAWKQDRIHLRTTHFNHAGHLEAMGDIAGAIKAYQLAEAHRYEVPRMLYELQHLEDLEAYIQLSGDKELIKWWAQYCESQGNLDKALHCYDWAGDCLSQVRLQCFQGDFAAAIDLVEKTSDAAAAFHLARQLEVAERIPQALHYFTRSGRVGHAVKLAQQYGMDNELLSLALQAPPPVMLSAAAYFEDKGMFEKAVLLYQKGGDLARAVEICFKAQLFDSLRMIADSLKEDADPALLARCADFFLQHNQFEKAAHLFLACKKHDQALDLCIDHGVIITEEMAEAMTPAKEDRPEERTQLLKRIAKCCKEQGSYHLACKKYTQAGEKTKAMRVLLKSGDTDKIIFFANVSRQRELYVLAANYLQSLNWHNDPEIMKAIIQFYTKAGAMEQLAAFYEACAQIEIDEYRDYEKALGALREGLKYLSKAKGEDKEPKLASLNRRISMVDRFVQARKLAKSDPKQMVLLCNVLLDQIPAHSADLESGLRVGDIFAHLIEHHYSQGDAEQAYQLIEKMRDRNIVLGPYLENNMVQDIYKAMGIELAEDEVHDQEDVGIGEEMIDE